MKKISKEEAIKIIETKDGRFMTISAEKNNGEMRVYKSSKFNGIMHGKYINIWEKANGFRNVNPDGLKYIKANKQEFLVA